MNIVSRIIAPACVALGVFAGPAAQAQTADTGFFLTSNGIGNGGNLGGLAGADNHARPGAGGGLLARRRRGVPTYPRRRLTARPR